VLLEPSAPVVILPLPHSQNFGLHTPSSLSSLPPSTSLSHQPCGPCRSFGVGSRLLSAWQRTRTQCTCVMLDSKVKGKKKKGLAPGTTTEHSDVNIWETQVSLDSDEQVFSVPTLQLYWLRCCSARHQSMSGNGPRKIN
jgi:hypothetical protein